MLSIDTTAARDYCKQGANVLAASIGFSYNSGSGYTSAPTVSFSGGAGTGAAGTAVIVDGQVTAINITAAGTGYTSAPTITLTGGGGTGATATATIGGGGVTGATITNGGTGGTLTLTDNTSYPSGDSRKIVDIEVYDYFGGKKEGYMTTSASVIINLGGLNNSRGFAMSVKVVSTKGLVKDGSQFKISNSISVGSFDMEK